MNLLSEARNPICFSSLISNNITNRLVIITKEKEKKNGSLRAQGKRESFIK